MRSYGADTAWSRAQAQADLEELQRLAGGEEAPIPVGTLNDAVWAGFQQTPQDPIAALPSLPLLAARDLIHLGGYVLAQASGDLEQKVLATQPEMPAVEGILSHYRTARRRPSQEELRRRPDRRALV